MALVDRALRGAARFDALSEDQQADDQRFLAELKALLAGLPAADPPIDFGAGPYAWPDSDRDSGSPALPLADIEATGQRLLPVVQTTLGATAVVSLAPCSSQIGSGALPVERLPSLALLCRPTAKKPGKALLALEAAFRGLPVPVIGHIRDDTYHLDLRCLEAGDEARFAEQLAHLKF